MFVILRCLLDHFKYIFLHSLLSKLLLISVLVYGFVYVLLDLPKTLIIFLL